MKEEKYKVSLFVFLYNLDNTICLLRIRYYQASFVLRDCLPVALLPDKVVSCFLGQSISRFYHYVLFQEYLLHVMLLQEFYKTWLPKWQYPMPQYKKVANRYEYLTTSVLFLLQQSIHRSRPCFKDLNRLPLTGIYPLPHSLPQLIVDYLEVMLYTHIAFLKCHKYLYYRTVSQKTTNSG